MLDECLKTKCLISVIIPAYKAESCLVELCHRLKASLEKISTSYEIIMVEDCGGDNSWNIIQKLACQDSRIKGIQFSRNFGQHYAITAGLDHCSGEWVVIMDCDLQDQPEEILRLYMKAQEGYDVVLADRGKRNDSIVKKIISRVFYKIFNYFSGLAHNGQVGNFRIISKNVVRHYCLMREQLRFFGGLVTWMGFPTAIVEVKHASRFDGKSSYTFRKLRKLAIETIIAYSDKPLRLSIRFGFLVTAFAAFFGIYILLRALFYGSPITGWSSLIVSIYFIGGVIIATLGILGIYLGKVFEEIKRRPLYIIKESTKHWCA